MIKEHRDMWKIRRERAFPLNLETKEEQSSTARHLKTLKDKKKDETEEKRHKCRREKERSRRIGRVIICVLSFTPMAQDSIKFS